MGVTVKYPRITEYAEVIKAQYERLPFSVLRTFILGRQRLHKNKYKATTLGKPEFKGTWLAGEMKNRCYNNKEFSVCGILVEVQGENPIDTGIGRLPEILQGYKKEDILSDFF